MASLDILFSTLSLRKRPEDVAQMVKEILGGHLSREEASILDKAASRSLKHQVLAYTSMLQEFRKPLGPRKQVAKAEELFITAYHLKPEDCDKPELVESFLRHLTHEIGKEFGQNDFKADRLDRAARQNAGLDLSRRQYNKRFRLLTRIEVKLSTLLKEIRKYEFTLLSKSALASQLTWDEFSKDENTACFVAYLTARSNLRSEFTISGQQRAYDEIAAMLYERCKKQETTNWWAIAHIFPEREVLKHLSGEQKGELLARWFQILREIASLLKETWERSDINLQTMVVKRGNDSSTWNAAAGAWNRARNHWIALLHALDMDGLLDYLCPGKVLRLMAADVVAWHHLTGGTLDPNTLVWRELPLPWEVVQGEATCTREQIEEVCQKHNLDPVKSGWTGPRTRGGPVAFRPTPELVHGVTVANPFLATLLRKYGAYSGKPLKRNTTRRSGII